ncbi:unnamed protein product [Urochloa humidicola]
MGSVRRLRCRSCSLAEFIVAVVLLTGVGEPFSEVSVNKINLLPSLPLPTLHRQPPSSALIRDSPPASVALGKQLSPHPALKPDDVALGLGLRAWLGKQATAGAPRRAGLHHLRPPSRLRHQPRVLGEGDAQEPPSRGTHRRAEAADKVGGRALHRQALASAGPLGVRLPRGSHPEAGANLCACRRCAQSPCVLWLCCAGDVVVLRPSGPDRRWSLLLHGRVWRRMLLQLLWTPTYLLRHVGWWLSLQAVAPKSNGLIWTGCRQWAFKVRVKQTSRVSSRTPQPENLQMEMGTSFKHLLFCSFGSKYGSGKTSLNVRADLRLQSMLVLRFNNKRSRAKNILSPVKSIRDIRFKILNPHRHRPVRQPRGALAVLSECNKEDLRCFWHGLLAQRPRQGHHLCLLLTKCSFQIFRSPSTLGLARFYLSHRCDSFVVAQKLQLHLGWKIPKLCTLFLSY